MFDAAHASVGGFGGAYFEGQMARKGDVLFFGFIRNREKSLARRHGDYFDEIRSALLDVKTSDDQVQVANQQIVLAAEQLKESQDRYAAGVSGSLEVVQAQEAVTGANENHIQALYLNNVAKLQLVRALGEDLGIEPRAARVLLLGAGGAARAASQRPCPGRME
jgi:hypothetical protein